MRSKTRIAAFLFAVCLGSAAMTACGDSKDSKNTGSKSVEATDEIKNVPLNSGCIQIGDTVFRTGGYMTAAEFVELEGEENLSGEKTK